MSTRLLVVMLLISLAGLAGAQPGADPAVTRMPLPAPVIKERKSPGVATALTLLGIAAPFALIGPGITMHSKTGDTIANAGGLIMVVTPSFGHWYAGDWISFGLILRGAGAGLVVLAAASAEGDGDNVLGQLLLGMGTFGAGVIYDLVTAGGAANRYNAKHDPAARFAPIVMHGAGASHAGLALIGSF